MCFISIRLVGERGISGFLALQDCEPDLTKLVPVLFGHAPKVIAKLSPMADIHMTLDLLPDVTAHTGAFGEK